MLAPFSTGIGDCLLTGKPPQ